MDFEFSMDPYKILGVSSDATDTVVKMAYRYLVLRCHPDKFIDEALKAEKAGEFYKVAKAYEVIGTEEGRQRYDAECRLKQLREERKQMLEKEGTRTSLYSSNTERRSKFDTNSYFNAPPSGMSKKYSNEVYPSSRRTPPDTHRTEFISEKDRERVKRSEREKVRDEEGRRDREYKKSYVYDDTEGYVRKKREYAWERVERESSSRLKGLRDDFYKQTTRRYHFEVDYISTRAAEVVRLFVIRQKDLKDDSYKQGTRISARKSATLQPIRNETKNPNAHRRPGFFSAAPRALRVERYISGTLFNVPVSAFPDTGSSIDAVSEAFVKKNSIPYNDMETIDLRLPGSNTIKTIGTITADFVFKGESEPYKRVFHVLKTCVHDVVLGKSFLTLSGTLTRFINRIQKTVTSLGNLSKRVFLMGSSSRERILCSVNGELIGAYADTGSEVMLISRSFAEKHGWQIYSNPGDRTWLEFADGSCNITAGTVRNAELKFGLSLWEKTFHYDLHVLDDLPADIILSGDFLFENQVFSAFKDLFYKEIPAQFSETEWAAHDVLSRMDELFIIRKKQMEAGRATSSQSWQNLYMEELAFQDRCEEAINDMDEPDRSVAWAQELRRREKWHLNHPRPIQQSGALCSGQGAQSQSGPPGVQPGLSPCPMPSSCPTYPGSHVPQPSPSKLKGDKFAWIRKLRGRKKPSGP